VIQNRSGGISHRKKHAKKLSVFLVALDKLPKRFCVLKGSQGAINGSNDFA
jgi:hypothetical protein